MRRTFLLLIPVTDAFARSVALPADLSPRDPDAMTTAKTCRWTNCGDSCPTGFKPVPRNGGHSGEMMWDHTHCPIGGMMTLCCPTNLPQPVCTWRGHKNSGKCKPGCESGEAEVWTLKFGCKSGHQSACCSTNTASVSAYDNCRWEGCVMVTPGEHLYCSATYPSLVVLSSNGFAGEDACVWGLRPYCCRGDSQNFQPPAFSQCSWVTDIPGPLKNALSCKAACPPDHTKLALRYKPSEIPDIRGPETPEEPKKSAKVLEFEAALVSYIKAYDSKTCSADQKPKFAEWLQEDEEDQAQAMELELTGNNAGDPVLPPCFSWTRIVSELRDIIKRPKRQWSADQKLIAESWNVLVPSRWPYTSVADLAQFLEENPISSPDDVVNTVLYDFDMWVGIRKTIKTIKTKVCVEFEGGSTETLSDPSTGELSQSNEPPVNSTHTVLPRYITLGRDFENGDPREDDDETSIHYMPWLGRIFEGIRHGFLSLHYARWGWYQGHRTNDWNPGPFLELAYWIGETPGAWNPQMDIDRGLWRYRDLRTSGRTSPGLRDRWVVLHLHFDNRRGLFQNENGHTWTGFTAMTAFHAHSAVVDQDGRGWHVDSGGRSRYGQANTARTVLRCEWDNSELNRDGYPVTRMWIGERVHPHDTPLDQLDPDTAELLHFMHRLYREGYVNSAGLMPLLHPSQRNIPLNQYGELQTQRYMLLQDNPADERPSGDDIWQRPYGTNFRLPRDLNRLTHPRNVDYDYAIDMPNMRPQPVEYPWQHTELEPHPHNELKQTSEDAISGRFAGENLTHEAMDTGSRGSAHSTVSNMTGHFQRV